MDYERGIVLIQLIVTNPIFWLLFGISVFNITWMKFERNVRYLNKSESWPTVRLLDEALPLISYSIHFYGLFIGWVLYILQLVNIFSMFFDGTRPSPLKFTLLAWIVLVLGGGLGVFLSGMYGSFNLVKVYSDHERKARYLNRLSLSRVGLFVVEVFTIYARVFMFDKIIR